MKRGKLTFIGLGLFDENDISIKGLNVIKKSDKIYAEFYTAKLIGADIEKLEKIFNKKIILLDRDKTEKGDMVIESAKKENIVFLSCGDAMTATTHIDLRLRANKEGIETNIIHGSSIVTAVPSLLGLQNYKFGRTTTLAYPEGNYFPTSPYDIIKKNSDIGLHTLILLDIKSNENRYMTANEGIKLLLDMEKIKGEHLINNNSVLCVVARAGSSKPIIKADKIKNLIKMDFGEPLHTLVYPGNLHFIEIESLNFFADLPNEIGKKLHKL